MSMLEIHTSGSTVYYVDPEKKRFLRVKGATSASNLWFDGDWNDYINEPEFEEGKGLYLILARPMGAWQASTAITSIVEVPEDEVPKALSEEG